MGKSIHLPPIPEGTNVVIGRDGTQCDVVVPHKSVSHRHCKLGKIKEAFSVEDLDSTYGTFVNGSKVISRKLDAGDCIRFGNGPTFLFNERQLIAQHDGVSFELTGVSLRRGDKEILRDISLRIEPNEMIGVLGPSGCGKSTLLSCLSGVYEPSEGSIGFDGGNSLHGDNVVLLQSLTGIVPQKDLVFDELTVEQNLRFEAGIKCPLESPDEVSRRIMDAMVTLGLLAKRDKPVSILSGGEKKRVNVAIELISKPRLLLLDEPTSGIDPGVESSLVNNLKNLARRGTTVICVSHTITTLHYFDKVLLLRPISADHPTLSSVAYFGAPGMMFELTGVKSCDDLFKLLARPDEHGGGAWTIKEDGTPDSSETGHRVTSVKLEAGFSRADFDPAWQVQFRTIFKRSFACLYKDKASRFLTVLIPTVFAILIAVSQKEQSNTSFVCFFIVLAAFWLGMSTSVREIVKETKLYVRDKMSGLNPLAYFSGKMAYAGTICVLQSALLITVTMLVLFLISETDGQSKLDTVNPDFYSGLGLCFLLIPVSISAICGSAVGLMVSSLAKTENAAVVTLPLLVMPQLLLSRVSFGDANNVLEKSPFGFICHFQASNIYDGMLYLTSLPFITRPTGMVSHLLFVGDNWSSILIEWIYMVLLFVFHLYLAVRVFLCANRNRNDLKDWR